MAIVTGRSDDHAADVDAESVLGAGPDLVRWHRSRWMATPCVPPAGLP